MLDKICLYNNNQHNKFCYAQNFITFIRKPKKQNKIN